MSSLRKLNRISGRPIQNAITVVAMTYIRAIQNNAWPSVTPNTPSSPDRFHRIGVKATTDTIALMAPNSRVLAASTVGALGPVPVAAVKASISSWIR